MTKIDNLAFILYSHSSLKWIWNAFTGEAEKYFPIDCNKYFFGDIEFENNVNYKNIIYKNTDPYAKRLRDCLQEVEEDYVLIHHEDMIFYDDVDMEQFEYYYEILKANEEFSYIKLLRGGVSPTQPVLQFFNGIFNLQDDEQYRFAVQPAIWRKSHLLKILNDCINNNIYEMEEISSKYMIENKYKCLFAWNISEDKKRGMYHWDNCRYPFIATALCKGKWNDSEYDIEIENIKREYGLT
jgi:hypothetical protein